VHSINKKNGVKKRFQGLPSHSKADLCMGSLVVLPEKDMHFTVSKYNTLSLIMIAFHVLVQEQQHR
jgi:hypothetical protein